MQNFDQIFPPNIDLPVFSAYNCLEIEKLPFELNVMPR